MNLGIVGSPWRCAAVWAGVTGAAVVVALGALLPVLAEARRAAARGDLGAAGFDSLLVWGCAAAATAVICWLWLVASLVTLDAARGVSAARRGVPAGLRRAVLVLCGAALTSGLAAPVFAGETTSTGAGAPAQLLAGLRLPERAAVVRASHQDRAPQPVAAQAAAPAAAPAPTPTVPESTVVVAPGDTLWDLAADRLGPGASDEDTAEAWPALYALNRGLIGPDPGRIEPGQRLLLPPSGPDGVAR